ncbi:MAG: hypothetical protein WHS86_06145 [Desulfosoma sp.]
MIPPSRLFAAGRRTVSRDLPDLGRDLLVGCLNTVVGFVGSRHIAFFSSRENFR